MHIGNKIKELRKQRGITQEQLADSIGVSFQAVSKWENNISLPDITLAPALASYFGVSMDELFDYNLKEIEERALAIAKESWKYRDCDCEQARKILEEGLRIYPDNDILLNNLLYVIDYNENPDEVLEIASKVIDVTKDDATKYDACRFMAHAYKAKNDIDSARGAIELVPEFYFSCLRLKANILEGEEKWNAACAEEGEALYSLIFIKSIIAEYHTGNGDLRKALNEYEQALGVLDVMNADESWDEWREQFKKSIDKIKAKMN